MIEWVKNNAEHILAILGVLYTLALLIVKLTPTPRDDAALAKVSPLLRALAATFGLDLRQGREKPADDKSE